MSYLDSAKNVYITEMNSLADIAPVFDNTFNEFVKELDECNGTIVFTGVGKSGHICRKIVATMQSLGIKAFFLHPVESLHGDVGVICPKDIVVAISYSGNTKELIDIIGPVKKLGARVFSIVGKKDSNLEAQSEHTIVIPGIQEAYLDIVPTSSTTATLVIGDAIAIAIAENRKIGQKEFGMHHPNGQLGKRLTLRVRDIMIKGSENSVVMEGSTLEQAVLEMCRKSVSAVCIVDEIGKLKGYFTDGDFRRYTSQHRNRLDDVCIDDIMVCSPISLYGSDMLYDAIQKVISKHTVSSYPVVDEDNCVIGVVRMIDIVKSGLYS